VDSYLTRVPQELFDAASTLPNALNTGVMLSAEKNGARRRAYEIALRRYDLSHPWLGRFAADRERIDGRDGALLRRLLGAADTLCGTVRAGRSAEIEVAEWLRTPVVPDRDSLATLESVAGDIKKTLEKSGGNIAALRTSLEQAAGVRNRTALLAAAGDIEGVRKKPPGGDATLHDMAAAALSALSEASGDTAPLVQWVVGVAALLDGSVEYRHKVCAEFGPSAPSEAAMTGPSLTRAVAQALSAQGIAWGDAADDGSWAFRWEIERRAVWELSQTPIRFEAWPLGPMLIASLGLEAEAAERLVADARLRKTFGRFSPAEVCLRRLDLLRALKFVESSNPEVLSAALRFLPEIEEDDRRDLLADLLRAIIRMRTGPEAARCPDPVPLPQRFEELAGTLSLSAAGRPPQEAAAEFSRLLKLCTTLADRVTETAKGGLKAEGLAAVSAVEQVVACFDAALSAIPPDHHRGIEALRAGLLFVMVSLLLNQRRKAGDADGSAMKRIVSLSDEVMRTESHEPGYRLQWLMVRWDQATTGIEASAKRQEEVRADVGKYYDWVCKRSPIWVAEYRELHRDVNGLS
jgi:hypothetical protein